MGIVRHADDETLVFKKRENRCPVLVFGKYTDYSGYRLQFFRKHGLPRKMVGLFARLCILAV